jgi:hypothetical protein
MTAVIPAAPGPGSSEHGQDRICPFCQAAVTAAEAVSCPTCDSGYHADCWHEGAGCGIVGCGVERPADDPAQHTAEFAPAELVAMPDAHAVAHPGGTDGSRAKTSILSLAQPRQWLVIVAAIAVFGLPAVGAYGAVNNWFSGLTGTVYGDDEVAEIRATAEQRGQRAGYADGYDDGETDGRSEGYDAGLSTGQARGYDAGFSDGYDDGYGDGEFAGYDEGYTDGEDDGGATARAEGYDEGYDDGYDDGYDMGEIDGHSEGYLDGLDDSYDY